MHVLALPLGISLRFGLNYVCRFAASSSFISPDCVFLKSSIPLMKLSNLFLALLPVK